MEVNDNPNIDIGLEDAALGDELYRRLLQFFLRRAEELRSRQTPVRDDADVPELIMSSGSLQPAAIASS